MQPLKPGPLLQVILQVCPNPRKGVYGANLGKLATAAQKPPGLLLQVGSPPHCLLWGLRAC